MFINQPAITSAKKIQPSLVLWPKLACTPARELLLQDSGSQDKGAVHKQVCVMLNVKLLGGVASGDVIELHILVPHVCWS